MRISDWSSDVCSSDLARGDREPRPPHHPDEDRGIGARQGKRRRVEGPARHAPVRTRQSRTAVGRTDAKVAGREGQDPRRGEDQGRARRRARPRSEEHTSELQSLMRISYAGFCLKKKKTINTQHESKKKRHEKRRDKTPQYHIK